DVFFVVDDDHSPHYITRLTASARAGTVPPMKSLGVVAILLSACAHDSGGAAGTAGPENVPAGKYALHLKLNPGEVRKYQVEVQVQYKVLVKDAQKFDAPMTMKFTQVLETGQKGADGATELKERIENLDISAEGELGDQMKPMMAGLTKVVIISNLRRDGTIASTKTEGAD